MARETPAQKKKRLAAEATAAAKTTDELTEDAMAEVADPEEPEAEAEPEQEAVTPALRDTSLMTRSGIKGRVTKRVCDWEAEDAAKAAAKAEPEDEDEDEDDDA